VVFFDGDVRLIDFDNCVRFNHSFFKNLSFALKN
jgi:hypothetical protein